MGFWGFGFLVFGEQAHVEEVRGVLVIFDTVRIRWSDFLCSIAKGFRAFRAHRTRD